MEQNSSNLCKVHWKGGENGRRIFDQLLESILELNAPNAQIALSFMDESPRDGEWHEELVERAVFLNPQSSLKPHMKLISKSILTKEVYGVEYDGKFYTLSYIVNEKGDVIETTLQDGEGNIIHDDVLQEEICLFVDSQ